MRLIEIASVLTPHGDKRVAIRYDDQNDILYVDDNGVLKEVGGSSITENITNITNIIQNLDVEGELINIKQAIEAIYQKIGKCNCGSALYTPSCKRCKTGWYRCLSKDERKIYYYYYCMTNNFGQGEGKMFSNWPQIPFSVISYKWNRIKEKYSIC